MNITIHYFIIIVPSSLSQVIYACYICMVEILHNSMLLHISLQLHVHISSLKSARMGILTPWKSENTTNQEYSQWFAKHLPHPIDRNYGSKTQVGLD